MLHAVPVPAELKTDRQHITVETNYPFENSLVYTVEGKADFVLQIRIPPFAENLTVDGQPVETGDLSIAVRAGECRTIRVAFETPVVVEQRPYGLQTVRRGSLVFSVPIRFEKRMHEYEKNDVPRTYPYCDYEYVPVSDWNYAYCSDVYTPEIRAVSDIPFSGEKPPLVLKTSVQKIPWGLADGYETVCAKVPESREPLGDPEPIELWPYGCARLRMTELPGILK